MSCMAKRLTIILILLPFFIRVSVSQDISKDNLLKEMVNQYGQARVTIPFTGVKAVNDLSQSVSISSVKDKTIEIVLSPLTVDWFIIQKFDYIILENADIKGIITSSCVKQAMAWETYPSYDQYDSIMQSFTALYPAICRLDTIGTTNYGKMVLAVKISDNAGTDEDEPEAFYTSTIHGDETGGFVLMLRLADYLLRNYGMNSRVKNLVDNLEIWINPLANPDGTYRNGNIISSPTRDNAEGEDLNRNFPDPQTPNTIRQKETLDMMEFMRKHNFVISANFHSGSEVINYPWDSRWQLHADNDWFYSISRKYADTVHMHSAEGYMTFMNNGVTNGYAWYSINGGRQDFVTYELHGREVTIELDDEYITPASRLNSLWQYNRRSLIGYLENALWGIHGYISDLSNGDPVPARIFIPAHDKDSSHIYSDSLRGSFIRYLSPGSWDMEFSASGYVNAYMDNVIVTEGNKTEINIIMVPFVNPNDTVDTPELILYPNPAKEFLKAVLPESLFGKVNVKIYNTLGEKLTDYPENAMEDIPLYIDLKNLASGVYLLVVSNSDTRATFKKRFVVVRR